MAADLKKKRRNARYAVLLAHHHDERQQFLEHLMGAAGVGCRAYTPRRTIFYDPTRRYCLRSEVLTRRLGWTHDVSGPEKRKNLTIAIFKQSDGAYDTLQNLNIMTLMLALPKQRTSAWNAGNDAELPASGSAINRKLGNERRGIAYLMVGKRMYTHEYPASLRPRQPY